MVDGEQKSVSANGRNETSFFLWSIASGWALAVRTRRNKQVVTTQKGNMRRRKVVGGERLEPSAGRPILLKYGVRANLVSPLGKWGNWHATFPPPTATQPKNLVCHWPSIDHTIRWIRDTDTSYIHMLGCVEARQVSWSFGKANEKKMKKWKKWEKKGRMWGRVVVTFVSLLATPLDLAFWVTNLSAIRVTVTPRLKLKLMRCTLFHSRLSSDVKFGCVGK